MSNGSHFLENCPHCPGHDAYGVIFYIFLPDHTEVKYGERALWPAIHQQMPNELLLRAGFCTGWVPSLPSHARPPQLLSVTSRHPSVLCLGLLPPQGIMGPVWASIHCIMHPPKRRDSELFPPRSRGGFETDSEKFNSCSRSFCKSLVDTRPLTPCQHTGL